MGTISLRTNQQMEVTLISNEFIDNYMPTANGAYVKVYLYLLRCLNRHPENFSITMLADHLDNTENDIIRAISYWEKANLLTVTRNDSNEIIELMIHDPATLNAIDHATQDNKKTQVVESTTTQTVEITEFHYNIPPKTQMNSFDKPTYTQAQIDTLTTHDEVKWMMNIIEIYLERLLKPSDVQLILYLYESVGFSAELIMYLYEYCVSKNKKNTSYIEAVALSWANDGIDTVEKAENATTLYNTNYNAVSHAFGLNRAPGNIEKQYVNKWLHKFGFSIDIIVEACNRTLLRTGKPDFKYADKILENWYGKQVKDLNDITTLDQVHNKTKANQPSNKTMISNQTKPNNNKFTAFSQRNYSKEDFSKMEQHLLSKQ